jgi:hypothetical protein
MSRALTVALACIGAIGILLATAGFYALASAEQIEREQPATSVEDVGSANLSERVAGDGTKAPQQRVPAGQGNYPMRWRVSFAAENTSLSFCGTAVVVTNLTSDTLDVEVEWVDDNGDRYVLDYGFIDPLDSDRWITDDEVLNYPFQWNQNANLGDFRGYAIVYASDPRVMASAFLYCRSGTGASTSLVSISNIPTFPVGATLDLFQAAVPAMGGAPVVEVPESR